MKTVRKFDEDDADILGKGQQHFTQIFSVTLGSLITHLIKFGDALNQKGDVVSKRLADVFWRDTRVLAYVVQKRARDSFSVKAHINQAAGSRCGVNNIWLPGFPFLSPVGFCRKSKRAFHE